MKFHKYLLQIFRITHHELPTKTGFISLHSCLNIIYLFIVINIKYAIITVLRCIPQNNLLPLKSRLSEKLTK